MCSNSRPRSRSAIQGRCAYGHTPVFHSRRGGMRAPRTKTTATARVICLIDYQQSEQSRRRLWSRLREQVWSAERASVSASRMRRTSRNHICPTPATGRAQGDQQPLDSQIPDLSYGSCIRHVSATCRLCECSTTMSSGRWPLHTYLRVPPTERPSRSHPLPCTLRAGDQSAVLFLQGKDPDADLLPQ